jgi:hypothetical protein
MNSFQQTLQTIEGGNLADDLADKLASLIGQVKERGKAGGLTVSLKIKPLDADAESVSVVATVKVSEPAKAERASIFFTTDDNLLVRNNPRQTEMKLEPVDKPDTKPAKVAKAS